MAKARVFISHRQADSNRAREWAGFLSREGIESYLDILDPTPQTLSGRAVSRYLHDQLRLCTHTLVVFTDNTVGSMWVPFEIGIATERDIGIAIDALVRIASLPEYLLDWPVLRETHHYHAFVAQLQKTESESRYYKSIGMRYSDEFHAALKRAIART